MCGILGGNSSHWDYKAGLREIRHRGPDGERICRKGNVTLGFVRLAIRDLSERAMQPMQSRDGKVWIVFNGEIYGYSSLKKQLAEKYVFSTTSDTEVILNAYLEYGDKFIDKIDGMFAIAIYDEREGLLKLYRDRAGIKPLYYFYDGKRFAFASELKALKAMCSNLDFQIDRTAVYDFLFYQYIPAPKSMYKNVYKLEPAHTLFFQVDKKQIVKNKKYWKLHVNASEGRTRSREEVCARLRQLIQKSVKEQMAADVEVGTYLSGGVDSSVVTYEASRLNEEIKAFSIGFKNRDYDESRYARMLAEQYGILSRQEILGKKEIEKTRGKMAAWYDEPFADVSAYPTYELSKMAREAVTVVLTGDGSDELFGGYKRYKEFYRGAGNWINMTGSLSDAWIERMLGKRFLTEEDDKRLFSPLSYYGRLLGFRKGWEYEEYRKAWKIPRDYDQLWYLKKYYKKELPVFTRLRYLDFKTYLPDDILTKVDRTSMAVSLEARVPFLSREIIEFSFSLSQEECCPAGELKGILKEAYQKVIPDEILYRPKMGFGVPGAYIRNRNHSVPRYEKILKEEWPQLCRH